jgi:hypothetical protein
VETVFKARPEFNMLTDSVKERPITLELMREYMLNPYNMATALGYKKYILHYYRRESGFDEEIVPAKFPLRWEIDSTAIQTEGTYIVTFETANQVVIDFHCDACTQIDQRGARLPGTKTDFKTSFEGTTNSLQKTADWAFKLTPRKAAMDAELGKQYLVRIEARDSYIHEAQKRLSIEEKFGGYRMKFTDPFGYMAEKVLIGMGIAMVNEDRANRQKAIDKVNESMRPERDSLAKAIDSLKLLLPRDGRSGQAHAALKQAEERYAWLMGQKQYWDKKYAAFLPRMLTKEGAFPCGSAGE